jgi:G3E family GTPase
LLRTTHGSQLLRVKGLLNVRDHEQPFVIHGVQHVFYPVETLDRWPSPDRRSRIVFITRDLDEAKVRAVFDPLIGAGPQMPAQT